MRYKIKISIIVPSLGRPEKLRRLLLAIKENAGYDNYDVIVKMDDFPPNNIGVPKLLKEGVTESTGELIVFMGNDCLPQPNFLRIAVFEMARHYPDMDGLIAFNDGYWHGEFATHWLASKKLLPRLAGEFFHTGYFHCGCDNELSERCKQMGKYHWSEKAKITHDHPFLNRVAKQDAVYDLAYRKDRMEHDRDLLAERAKKFGFTIPEFYSRPQP